VERSEGTKRRRRRRQGDGRVMEREARKWRGWWGRNEKAREKVESDKCRSRGWDVRQRKHCDYTSRLSGA
jgi:hypothetical protein